MVYLSQSDNQLSVSLDVFGRHINHAQLIQCHQALIDVLEYKQKKETSEEK